MVNDVIEKFGGIRPTAKALGIPVSTVANWKLKDKIPSWRWTQIETALRTREDFEDQNRGRGNGNEGC